MINKLADFSEQTLVFDVSIPKNGNSSHSGESRNPLSNLR
jgi:hypothetical protein